jgi:hypothetical protein
MEGCVGMPTTTSKLGWDIGSAFNEMGKCRKYSRLEEDGSGSAVGGDDGNSLGILIRMRENEYKIFRGGKSV